MVLSCAERLCRRTLSEAEEEEEGAREQGGRKEKEGENMAGDQPLSPSQLLLRGWGAVLLFQGLSPVFSQIPDPEVRP